MLLFVNLRRSLPEVLMNISRLLLSLSIMAACAGCNGQPPIVRLTPAAQPDVPLPPLSNQPAVLESDVVKNPQSELTFDRVVVDLLSNPQAKVGTVNTIPYQVNQAQHLLISFDGDNGDVVQLLDGGGHEIVRATAGAAAVTQALHILKA